MKFTPKSRLNLASEGGARRKREEGMRGEGRPHRYQHPRCPEEETGGRLFLYQQKEEGTKTNILIQ